MSKRVLPERAAKTKAKKLRIEEGNGSQNEDLSDLERLPDEIAEEIIACLSFKDILELSVVSHRLKKFIAGSLEARKKLVFHFPASTSQVFDSIEWQVLAGQRNYSRVVFDGSLSAQVLTKALMPLKKFGKYVKEIKIKKYSTKTMMSRILHVCPKVESVSVEELEKNWRLKNNQHPAAVFEGIKESFPHLNEIKLPANSSLLDLFLKCQVKHFEAFDGMFSQTASTREATIKFFLNKQQKLESLNLSLIGTSFFSDEPTGNALNKVPFQLKKLNLQYTSLRTMQHIENFRIFVNCHRETLEYLKLSAGTFICDLASMFSDFQALKKITLKDYVITDSVVMENIERMKAFRVDVSGNQKFNEKFPNLKILKLHRYLSPLIIKGIAKLEHLQILILRNCIISNTIKVLNVKSLILECCTFNSQSKLVAINRAISHLSLIGCVNADWITDFVNHPDTKLKTLSCCKMKLSTRCREAINKNAGKIKKVTMINVDFI